MDVLSRRSYMSASFFMLVHGKDMMMLDSAAYDIIIIITIMVGTHFHLKDIRMLSH